MAECNSLRAVPPSTAASPGLRDFDAVCIWPRWNKAAVGRLAEGRCAQAGGEPEDHDGEEHLEDCPGREEARAPLSFSQKEEKVTAMTARQVCKSLWSDSQQQPATV